MLPRDHFVQIVVPNIDDAQANPDCIRRAWNALAAMDATAGNLFYWAQKFAPQEVAGINDDTDYRTRLGSCRQNLRLLFDVAKALKHGELTRGRPLIRLASEVASRSFGHGETYGFAYGGGTLVSVLYDGQKVPIEFLLVTGRAFFTDEIVRLEKLAQSSPSASASP